MRQSVSQTPGISSNAAFGPVLIGAGLTVLIAASWSPAAPIVTAMAIISLGATDLTLARFRHTPASLPVVILHGATYACLYGLFIGATLHAAAASSTPHASLWATFDVAASLLPMAIAAQRLTRYLRQSILQKH